MATGRNGQIGELMESASSALNATSYFDAEQFAHRALLLARQAQDFDAMARICLPLQEARRQRMQAAFDAPGEVRIVDQPFAENFPDSPGCYLVQPMLVGADARRLRVQALARKVPAAILCREPLTSMGLQPIVALGDLVVRARIRPARNDSKPDKRWFIEAMEQLGDAAIDEIDPDLKGVRRVDALLERLEAIPDHEKLHQRLADAARDAARPAQPGG